MTQWSASVNTRAWISWARLMKLVLFEDAHGDGVRAAGWIVECQGGAHYVRKVRDGDEQAHDGDQCVGVEHAEADEQEDQSPDEAAEVEFRVRVDAGDVA